MKPTIRFYLALFFMAVFLKPSFATWSIIVMDANTKQIGIAGASCTYSVYGIGAIVPGKGAIVVQAMSSPLARAEGIKMMVAGAMPDEILHAMMRPMFYPEQQQYAIMCMDDLERPLTFTGTSATPGKGALTANGISVQGNTLTTRQCCRRFWMPQ